MGDSDAKGPAAGQTDEDATDLAPTTAHTWRVVLLGGTAILLLTGGLWLWARSGFATPPELFLTTAAMLALAASTATQTGGGLIIAVRRPGNMVGWVILLFASAIGLTVFVNGYLALAGTGWAAPIDPSVMALLPGVVTFPVGGVTAIALGIIFPDGHVAAPRYRPFIAAAAFGGLLFALGVAGTPGPILWYPGIENPLPVPGDSPWPAIFRYVLGPALLILGGAGTTAALLDRYRRADSVGRLQLRWYVTSAVLLWLGFVAFLVSLYTLPADSWLGALITFAFFLAQGLPPVFMVIAISRYHLYDIDVIIGRAVVYGGLTAILAGTYAASIRLFNALFVGLTGESSEVVLVITTLILATTFTPIKSRLERFVAGRMGDAEPSAAATAVLDDPAFTAVLDERIRVALTESAARPARRPTQPADAGAAGPDDGKVG